MLYEPLPQHPPWPRPAVFSTDTRMIFSKLRVTPSVLPWLPIVLSTGEDPRHGLEQPSFPSLSGPLMSRVLAQALTLWEALFPDSPSICTLPTCLPNLHAKIFPSRNYVGQIQWFAWFLMFLELYLPFITLLLVCHIVAAQHDMAGAAAIVTAGCNTVPLLDCKLNKNKDHV